MATTSNQPLDDPWDGTQPTDYERLNGVQTPAPAPLAAPKKKKQK